MRLLNRILDMLHTQLRDGHDLHGDKSWNPVHTVIRMERK